jgi:hypothetical protein
MIYKYATAGDVALAKQFIIKGTYNSCSDNPYLQAIL